LNKSPAVRYTHSEPGSRIEDDHSKSQHKQQNQNHPDRNRPSNPKTYGESEEKDLTRSVKAQSEEHANRIDLPGSFYYPKEPFEVSVEKTAILQQFIQLRLVNTSPSNALEHPIDPYNDQSIHRSYQEEEQT